MTFISGPMILPSTDLTELVDRSYGEQPGPDPDDDDVWADDSGDDLG